jgi:hypothetical protein
MTHSSSSNTMRCYCVHIVEWQGINLEIRHSPNWVSGMDHIEIHSLDREPLPITETGYKSLFIPSVETDITEAPADYVLAWLDHESTSDEWQSKAVERAQLSLF